MDRCQRVPSVTKLTASFCTLLKGLVVRWRDAAETCCKDPVGESRSMRRMLFSADMSTTYCWLAIERLDVGRRAHVLLFIGGRCGCVAGSTTYAPENFGVSVQPEERPGKSMKPMSRSSVMGGAWGGACGGRRSSRAARSGRWRRSGSTNTISRWFPQVTEKTTTASFSQLSLVKLMWLAVSES